MNVIPETRRTFLLTLLFPTVYHFK